MLVILSEIDCIDKLNNNGIYPDKFFTDVDLFRNHAISFTDAHIIIIFAGNCRFNKKHTIELVKYMYKRSENQADRGISSLFVLSDSELPLPMEYFRFSEDLFELTRYRGKRNMGLADIWGSVSSVKKEAEVFLSDYDKGSYIKEKSSFKRASSEEDLIRLIRVPDVKTLLKQAN